MWVETFARFGYAAKGVVYGLIGVLAVLAAFTASGKTTDTQGALHTIAAQPFGQVILILIAIGLVGYFIWRIVEAIKDPDHKGNDAKGILTRLGYAISGIIYGGIAVNAFLLAIGSSGGGGSGSSSAQDWTAKVLAQPFGQWLVGIGGALIIGLGFYYIYKGFKVKFRRKLDLHRLNIEQEKLAVHVSRFGLAARGVVFVLIGIFVIQAARQSDASEVKGLDGALQTLAQQPYGKILLGVVALGLIAYGIYMFIQARFRHFKT